MQLTKNLLLSEDMAFAVEKHTYHSASNMSESHYHDHYEMLYVLENERHIIVNNQTYTLNSGNIALIAPYTPHRTTAGERTPQTRILVNFKESFIRWLVDKLNIDFLSCFNPASAVVVLLALYLVVLRSYPYILELVTLVLEYPPRYQLTLLSTID